MTAKLATAINLGQFGNDNKAYDNTLLVAAEKPVLVVKTTMALHFLRDMSHC
jgi:hypothetical protein